jgi:phenylalanyl-tRNA synthetase beta chain
MLDLTLLRTLAAAIPKVRTLDALPAVERDLAVVVKRDTAAEKVENAMRSAAGPDLASITLFDRYTGAPLADDEVSLAYRLRFQPTTEGLSEAQLDEAVKDVRNALEKEVEGRIRAG